MGNEVTRVTEISQRERESGLFPGQKPDGCSSNREKTQEGEQYSTLRVENAFRKTCQSCEILWGRGGAMAGKNRGKDRNMSSCLDNKEVGVVSGHPKVGKEETGVGKCSQQGTCLAIGKEEGGRGRQPEM